MKIEWEENDDFCGIRVVIRGKENEEWAVTFTNHVIQGFADMDTVYGLTSMLDGMTVYLGDRKKLAARLNNDGFIPISRREKLYFKRKSTPDA